MENTNKFFYKSDEYLYIRFWQDNEYVVNTAETQQHPFHVLGSSRLPFFMGLFSGCLAITLIIKLQNITNLAGFMAVGSFIMEPFFFVANAYPNMDIPDSIIDTRLFQCLSLILLTIWSWSRELIRESIVEGLHTEDVQTGLLLGFQWFIISEAMLFFPFFWSFFHASLSPSIFIGNVWPPTGISFDETLDPFMLPFVNTIVLLTSGVALVAAHRAVYNGEKAIAFNSLFIAISLGILFSWLQFLEYGLTKYTITDGMFGSTFFMLTGLHGFHVIVGTCLLIITYWRLNNNQFAYEDAEFNVLFECAAFYWHFVDVVWLFVFVFVYCWGVDLGMDLNIFNNR